MKNLVILFSFSLSFSIFAGEILVYGKSVSDTRCNYSSTVTGTFQFIYKNDLPWGSRVILKMGHLDAAERWAGAGPSDWVREMNSEMIATAPYTWEISFSERISSRSEYHFSHLDFVFMIVLPDGQVYYEKGNESTFGYYRAQIPTMACFENVPMELMNVVSVAKY